MANVSFVLFASLFLIFIGEEHFSGYFTFVINCCKYSKLFHWCEVVFFFIQARNDSEKLWIFQDNPPLEIKLKETWQTCWQNLTQKHNKNISIARNRHIRLIYQNICNGSCKSSNKSVSKKIICFFIEN